MSPKTPDDSTDLTPEQAPDGFSADALATGIRPSIDKTLTAKAEPVRANAESDTELRELSPEQRETLLATLKNQYENLPESTILVEDHSWEDALTILK